MRTICEDTASSEEMTRKALRGAVRHFPRVLKSITSTANLGANLGEIAEQEWLVPIDSETKKKIKAVLRDEMAMMMIITQANLIF